MDMKHKHSLLVVASLLLFLIFWSVLLYHISPQEIVEYIGVENSIIVAFFVSTFGGLSSFTAGSYYGMIITLASGGASPILLGISTGVGLTISDSLVYYLGTRGHEVLTGRPKKWADKIAIWVSKQNVHLVQAFAYVYTGLTPMPNDLLTGSLGLAEYSFKRLLPAMLLGNITLSIIIAEFAVRSELIARIFGV